MEKRKEIKEKQKEKRKKRKEKREKRKEKRKGAPQNAKEVHLEEVAVDHLHILCNHTVR